LLFLPDPAFSIISNQYRWLHRHRHGELEEAAKRPIVISHHPTPWCLRTPKNALFFFASFASWRLFPGAIALRSDRLLILVATLKTPFVLLSELGCDQLIDVIICSPLSSPLHLEKQVRLLGFFKSKIRNSSM